MCASRKSLSGPEIALCVHVGWSDRSRGETATVLLHDEVAQMTSRPLSRWFIRIDGRLYAPPDRTQGFCTEPEARQGLTIAMAEVANGHQYVHAAEIVEAFGLQVDPRPADLTWYLAPGTSGPAAFVTTCADDSDRSGVTRYSTELHDDGVGSQGDAISES